MDSNTALAIMAVAFCGYLAVRAIVEGYIVTHQDRE